MLTFEEKAAALGVGDFSSLGEDIIIPVAERAGERDFMDGDILFMQGEPGTEIFVLVSGEVEIIRDGISIAVLGPGELIGEMAVLGKGIRTAEGRARGKTKALFLKDKAVNLLCQQFPELNAALFKIIIDRLTEADDLIVFLSGDKKPVGIVEVLSPSSGENKYPICHNHTFVGKSKGSILADGLRLTLPDEKLEVRHAAITNVDGVFSVEPLDGKVLVGGDEIEDRVAVGPEEEITLAGLKIRILPVEKGE
ncbi:MAG: cyclic nucleotide-binding domain-containing protein [Planctomycetota bacterium]